MRHLLCLLTLLMAFTVAADTYVGGDIVTDETWTPAGSPYIVQGHVNVTASATLTIQSTPSAGVTVKFDGYYELQTEASGKIVAQGHPDHHVLFTSNQGSPAPQDWRWIEIVGSETGSSFDYCTVEYGRSGIRPNNRNVTVTNCTVRYCTEGFYCLSTASTISHCDIYGNRFGVVIVNDLDTDLPTITNCDINDNSDYNLQVTVHPAPLVSLNAENNWWGTDVESEIQDSIRDNDDNPSVYIQVDYTPWRDQAPVEEASWARVKALFAE